MTQAAQARLEVILDTYLSVGTPVQRAAGRLLAGGGAIQRQILERAARNLQALDTCLGRQRVSSRLEVEGGWSVVLRVPSIRSDEEWALEILEEAGVLVHPGHFFEFRTEGYLVLSLIVPEEAFEAGVSRLLGLVAAAAPGHR
jgi:aspartate/methionine/tyrosine aminotransferase